MPRNQLKIYRGDRRREAVWEALDALPAGAEFTLRTLWNRGRVGAGFPMTEAVLRDAVRIGAVEHLGRLKAQGAPKLYRRAR
jgi:hypothetical protein